MPTPCFLLSVFRPMARPVGGAVMRADVYTIHTPAGQSLQWVREHADELAQQINPAPYVALNVQEVTK